MKIVWPNGKETDLFDEDRAPLGYCWHGYKMDDFCEHCEYEWRIREREMKETKSSMTYRIEIPGCDDTTIFNMELTPEEYKTIRRLDRLSREYAADGKPCKPHVEVIEDFVMFSIP